MESIEKEPQIKADERRLNEPDNCAKSCHGSEKLGIGMSTYAPQGICARGVENPQDFVSDERRLNALSEGIIGVVFEIGNVSGVDILNIRAGD